MKSAETINLVCSELGITKAELAKRMGMFPSSLYRKLGRESMTFEELQKCLSVLGVTMECTLQYPDGHVRSAQMHDELLLERMEILKTELEAAKNTVEFQKKALRDLRTELNSAVGYAALGRKHSAKAEAYIEKMQSVFTNMECTITYTLGEAMQEEPEVEEPESVALLEGRRVLLVDDNELNREIMKQILMEHGLLVEEAGNGKAAVEAIQGQEPGYFHFILLDIEMPVMDGYETTMQIRKCPNRIRANIPIVALTANACHENRERAKAVGMDDFLAKPVDPQRLLRSLIKFR